MNSKIAKDGPLNDSTPEKTMKSSNAVDAPRKAWDVSNYYADLESDSSQWDTDNSSFDSDDMDHQIEELEVRLASFEKEMLKNEHRTFELDKLARNGLFRSSGSLTCAFCDFHISCKLRCVLHWTDIIDRHCAKRCTVALANK